MTNFFQNKKFHIIFISILSLNYILPLIFFGKITLFWHDTLDSEIPSNYVLGSFLGGNLESIKILLNGEIKIEYLRRLFQPFSIFYSIFNLELAYWIIDILVRLTSYFSFYILAKKISKDKLISCLLAAVYVGFNLRSQDGFGIAIMPYIVYLISFKPKIKYRDFFIVFFFGINTDFATCIPQIPALVLVSFILNKNEIKNFYTNCFFIILIFVASITLSNANLIYAQLGEIDFHRSAFFYESLPFLKNIFAFIEELFFIPLRLDWTLAKVFPAFIIFLSIFIVVVARMERKELEIIFLILLINVITFITRTELFVNLRNSTSGLFKSFHFEYVHWVVPMLYLILITVVLSNKNKFTSFIKIMCFSSLFLFQINSSVIPFVKKNFLSNGDYRNMYTFKDYYMYDDYTLIKKFVGEKRVMTIGFDPMIAVVNEIKVIDGFHNIYPLKYKLQFRKIIEKELENNSELKKYYDNYGNRVYAFVNEPNNIDLDFSEAKKIGAEFVISKYKINLTELEFISDRFKNKIFLYQIK